MAFVRFLIFLNSAARAVPMVFVDIVHMIRSAFLAICFEALLAGGGNAVAAESFQDKGSGSMSFDIPALPLAKALERFMAATNVAILADSILIAGRKSTALHGRFLPDSGLRALLTAADLEARSIGPEAYMLVQLPPIPRTRLPPRFIQYAAALQWAVTSALCQRDDTRPTHYRLVMRFWLSSVGAVTRIEFADSTGNPSLDMAIGHALQRLDVGMPAPAGLPQPVKLAILPMTRDAAACPPSETGSALVPAH
jgi:hypothetical protein